MRETYIHYGHSHFDINKFDQVHNITFRNKPFGGLWSCPTVDKDIDWNEWCINNDFDANREEWFKFVLSEDAKVKVVCTNKDLETLPRIKEYKNAFGSSAIFNEDIDFEALAKEYDAILVYMYRTNEGWLESMYQKLYGWDVDTLFVFNPNIIKEVDSSERHS